MAGSSSTLLVVLLMLCCSCAVVAFAAFALQSSGALPGLPGLPGAAKVDESTIDDILGDLSADADDALALTSSGASWTASESTWWTAGFMPGCWWKAFDLSQDAKWKKLAEDATQALAAWQSRTDTHDVGFVIMSSYGQMPDPPAAALVKAAGSLAKRYDASKKLFRSWGDIGSSPFKVIIDNMMNLHLMFTAAGLSGGKAEWKSMAENHALRAAELFVRSDGSTCHVVEIDGDTIKKRTHQGAADDSCWARGQAWAMYGFAQAYDHAKNKKLLDAAKKVTKYFVDNLPADNIPFWDFKASKKIKDTSAAAVAACALFMLGEASGSSSYRSKANAILNSLLTNYRGSKKGLKSLLCCACESVPQNKGVNVGYIPADYYVLEAMQLARG